jgi:hypothetical protein
MHRLMVLILIGGFGCGVIREDVSRSSPAVANDTEAIAVADASSGDATSTPGPGWSDGPPTTDELRLFGVWLNVGPGETSSYRTVRTVEFDPDGVGKCVCRTQSDRWQGAWRLSRTSHASGWRRLNIDGKDVAEIRFQDEEKLKMRPVGIATRDVDAELSSKLPDGIWNNEDAGETSRSTDDIEAKGVTFWRRRKWSGGLSSGLPDGTWIKEDYVDGQRFDRFVRFEAGVRQHD